MYAPPDEDNPNYTPEGLLALRRALDPSVQEDPTIPPMGLEANRISPEAFPQAIVWGLFGEPESRVYVPTPDEATQDLVRALAMAIPWVELRIVPRDEAQEQSTMARLPSEDDAAAWRRAHNLASGTHKGMPRLALKKAGLLDIAADVATRAHLAVVEQTPKAFFEEQPPFQGQELRTLAGSEVALQNLPKGTALSVDVVHVDPEPSAELTSLERQELEQLRREVQLLRNGQQDLAMGASIKLAAARMVLSRLLDSTRLTSQEQEALRGVFNMLPAPSTGHIAKADSIARANHPALRYQR